MYFIFYYLVLQNILIDITISQSQSNDRKVSVNTNSGQIYGFREIFDGKELDVFLGIPYAEPPINQLRFRKPVPISHWTQPLNTNQWPNNCYQIISTFELKHQYYSEDCLYLNIWSPITDSEESDDKPKAVIIFIPGGALYYGSATQDIYDGKALSSKGGVIVVTFNYRLDAFGFLYTDSDEAPGNVGLWDQLMAIQWINCNIEYFGGDPKQITLMGWDSGAWSASLHLLSPLSQHLFQNVILMSGAAYNHVTDREAKNMKQFWLNGAISIGCVDDSEYTFIDFTPEIMECLKKASPQKILQLATEVNLSVPKLGWFRLVVIDEQLIPDKPINLLKNNRLNTTINVLIGSVENEGSLALSLFYNPEKYDMTAPKKFTVEEAFDELASLSKHFASNLEIDGEEVSELYLYGLSQNSDFNEIISRIGSALGDFYFTCPSIRFAEKLFTSNTDNVNVYQYYYTNGLDNNYCSKWMKVCHSSDLWPVFGLPHQRSSSKRSKEISKQMIEMFSHFAKFGYPKHQNGLQLSPYYMISDKVVKPYYELSENPKPITNFGIGLKTIECEYLWNEFLDN